MRLTHTTGAEDATLTECNYLGGVPAEAADIAQNLDTRLTEALEQVKDLQNQLGVQEKALQDAAAEAEPVSALKETVSALEEAVSDLEDRLQVNIDKRVELEGRVVELTQELESLRSHARE